jgi:hypothetical protein
VERSLARGPSTADASPRLHRATLITGVVIVLAMLVVYNVGALERENFYNHFVWQAAAWLEGEPGIRYPVTAADGLGAVNEYFQDVLPIEDESGMPTGRALIPFPPLPALVLLPVVAVFGLTTDAALVAAILGALVVGFAFHVVGRLPISPRVRLLTTVLFGVGSVFWYASQLGSTWYIAHVIAVGLTLGAILIALERDPRAVAASAHDDWDDPRDRDEPEATPGAGTDDLLVAPEPDDDRPPVVAPIAWSSLWPVSGWQFLAGLLLGLAATARLPVVLGLPFFVLVGGGGNWLRRGASAALGAAIPVLGLVLYNLVTTGHLFHPAYEYLYRVETGFYPRLFPYLEYNPEWAIEDPRYIPQNLRLMLLGLPEILPECDVPGAVRGLFDATCPYVRPRADGLSLLLTTPAFLLAIPAVRGWGRGRLVTGAILAIVLIAILNLMHFSQGWVQFGYRFSNDFVPFLLLLVALGIERLKGPRWAAVAAVAVAVSIAVNAWGVAWGGILGW